MLAHEALRTRSEVSSLLAGARDPGKYLPLVLSALCRRLDFSLGMFWQMAPSGARLRLAGSWTDRPKAIGPFLAASHALELAPGIGLPGRVWSTRQPAWLADTFEADNFPRREAARRADLRAALAFPLLRGEVCLGVVELFAEAVREQDDELLELLAAVGGELAGFLALAEAESRFGALTQSTSDAVIVADGAGRMVSWNAGAERMFGHPPAEALGRPLAILMPERYRAAHERALAEATATGVVGLAGRTLELEGLHREGAEFPIELTLSGWRAGAESFFGGIVRDVSERAGAERALRRREAQLAEAQRIAQIGSWEWEIASDRIRWSDELYRMFGLRPEQFEASYEHYLEHVHSEDREMVARTIGRALEDGRPFSFQHRLVRPDGEHRVVDARGRVERDLRGQPVRMLGTAHDVTERRALEQLRDEFSALASHELRTPLTSVIGYLEAVLDEDAEPLTVQQRRFVEVAERNARKLVRLVGDLLIVAQSDAGRLALELEQVDLAALARECAEAAGPDAEDRGISLHLQVDPVPPTQADRARLGQVIDNLLSNALKFTPSGGRVDLRTARRGRQVELEVADTGMGISPADQLRLFERFYRTGAATGQSIPGTGLGLAITKMIVEAHGGRIDVQSEEGRGSTFQVVLPLADAASVGGPGLERSPDPGRASS
ncbi:MAG: hypothetical protein QOD86_1063 [Miltoncostaeaceae bacterium]|nr:hypothetical protein [Miltoncostaeaceae bacterium]